MEKDPSLQEDPEALKRSVPYVGELMLAMFAMEPLERTASRVFILF